MAVRGQRYVSEDEPGVNYFGTAGEIRGRAE